jgi:hypothetical protein
MGDKHPEILRAKHDCIVRLTELRDGWSISVTTGSGDAAVFHSHHRDKQTAVVTAITAAVAACGNLLILTKRHGFALMPADQLSVIGWPRTAPQ